MTQSFESPLHSVTDQPLTLSEKNAAGAHDALWMSAYSPDSTNLSSQSFVHASDQQPQQQGQQQSGDLAQQNGDLTQQGLGLAQQGLTDINSGNEANGIVELMQAAQLDPSILNDQTFLSALQTALDRQTTHSNGQSGGTGDSSDAGASAQPPADTGDPSDSGASAQPPADTGDPSDTGASAQPPADTGDSSDTGASAQPPADTGDSSDTGASAQPAADQQAEQQGLALEREGLADISSNHKGKGVVELMKAAQRDPAILKDRNFMAALQTALRAGSARPAAAPTGGRA